MGKLNDDIAFWHWARARQAKSGVSWSSYWATLISATVETAAPTNVVLTFPTASSATASDITCTVNSTARAVSSASWTGAEWTVVLESAIVFGDTVVVTFVPAASTANVTNNVSFTDNFNRADGALENGWTYNGTWAISSNRLVSTPAVTGSSVLTNGDFESGNPPTGWNAAASNSIAQDADVRTGSAGSASALVTVGGSNYAVSRSCGHTAGRFYNIDWWGKRGTAAALGFDCIRASWFTDTSWANKVIGIQSRAAANFIILNETGTGRHDDIVFKQLTTNQIFATRNFGVADIDISIDVIYTGLQCGGIVLGVDNTTTPTDYICITLTSYNTSDGATLYTLLLSKVVGGTCTEVLAPLGIDYSAGATLRVIKHGATIKINYNGKQIYDDQFVSDAGIVNNTIHGVFSTGSSFQIDNFIASRYVSGAISGTPVFTRTAQSNLWTTSGAKDWLGWPWMCESGGVWMLTYRAAVGHDSTDATALIHIRFSNDEGANWTAEDTYIGGGAVTGFPISKSAGGSSVGSAMLIPCPNGDVLCHYYEFFTGTKQYRSTDDGATWSDEGLIGGDAKIISIDDFHVNGNDIYIAVNYTTNIGGDPWVNRIYKSSNNGTTWTLCGTYATSGDEGSLVIAPNGQMIVIMRDPSAAVTYKYASNDYGVTWSSPVAVPELDVLQRPKMKLDGSGGILLHGRDVYNASRRYPVVYYSDDNGATWGRKFIPDTTSGNDTGYNDYLIKSDGSYYMITYKGTTAAAAIRRLTFTKA